MDTVFLSGQPVSKPYFINRKKEISQLYNDIILVKNGAFTNLAILGQRRVGKTSLVKNTISLLDEDEKIIPLFIDCLSVPSMRRLSIYIADSAKNAYLTKKNDTDYLYLIDHYIKKNAASFLCKFHEIDVSVASYIAFCFSIRDSSADEQTLFEQSLDYLEQLGHKKDVYFVVFFDEFAEIALRWGDNLPKILRTVAQQQTRVMYVLSSSAVSYMNELNYNLDSPFFKQLKIFSIDPFSPEETAAFVRDRLNVVDHTINDEAVNEIIKLTNCIPDYVQRIGSTILSFTENLEITADDVTNAYYEMLVGLDDHFNALFTKLNENADAYGDIVISTAKYTKPSKIAADAGMKANSIHYYLPYLMNLGIIKKTSKGNYEHVDPVFKEWIINKF